MSQLDVLIRLLFGSETENERASKRLLEYFGSYGFERSEVKLADNQLNERAVTASGTPCVS